MGSDVPAIRGTSEKASQGVWSVLCRWMYFPNDVLIERYALLAMNREPQTLDETM